MKVCVCLSIGRHPVSGNARMAPGDRVALELALSLGAPVTAVHAGPDTAVLRDYLGMGLVEICRIDTGEGDPVPALADFLAKSGADLVFTGMAAEAGVGSGMTPYLLGEALSWPVLSSVTGVALAEGLELIQAEEGGKRRRRVGSPPAVLAIDPRAVRPRLSTLAASRAGVVTTLAPGSEAPASVPIESVPARKRGARLRPGKTKIQAGAAVHTDLSAQAAARTIIDFLQSEGHLQPSLHPEISDRSKNV